MESVYKVFLILGFIFLGLVSLFGSVPSNRAPIKTIGPMQVSALENGLSLYQEGRQFYYLFSPFNDYLINSEGIKINLLSQTKQETVKSSAAASKISAVIDNLLGFFDQNNPRLEFVAKDKTIRYQAQVKKNRLTLNRDFKIESLKLPQTIASVITYFEDDLLYDKSGRLYSNQAAETINDFKIRYEIPLSPVSTSSRQEVLGKEVVIANPFLASTIVVRASGGQKLFINNSNRLLEIEESPQSLGKSLISSVVMDIYQNPMEAQKSL